MAKQSEAAEARGTASAAAKQAQADDRSAQRAEQAARSASEDAHAKTGSDAASPGARQPEERAPHANAELAPKKPAPVQRTAAAERASESALLFEARKAMAHDAAGSLRLLNEHAQRYPKGALVPEREVLAIEALRALGRTAEADARLASFEARYPDSLHLSRLRR
jgi:hypothetical protein